MKNTNGGHGSGGDGVQEDGAFGLSGPEGEAQRMNLLVSLCSLLNQFSSPQVRGDFLHGDFHKDIKIQILPQLDELRWTLFPRWEGQILGEPDLRLNEGASHLNKLLSRSTEIFISSEEEGGSSVRWGILPQIPHRGINPQAPLKKKL